VAVLPRPGAAAHEAIVPASRTALRREASARVAREGAIHALRDAQIPAKRGAALHPGHGSGSRKVPGAGSRADRDAGARAHRGADSRAERGAEARAERGADARARRDEQRAARHEAQLWRAYRAARRRSAAELAAMSGPVAAPSPSAVRCDATRNDLVEHYQPLVRVIAGALERRLPRRVERGDLETAANVGLISAIEAFDPARGVPFELYAEHRLRGALLDELRNQDWLPRPWRARLEVRRRTIDRLRAELGRDPWDEEVANALAISLREYHQDYGPALVEGPAGQSWSEDGRSFGGPALEGVPDQGREAPEERLTRDDLLRLVAQKLSVQEYRLVYLKYWEDMPLREIGTVLGLSESRVCKIHMALLDRLRDKLSSDRR